MFENFQSSMSIHVFFKSSQGLDIFPQILFQGFKRPAGISEVCNLTKGVHLTVYWIKTLDLAPLVLFCFQNIFEGKILFNSRQVFWFLFPQHCSYMLLLPVLVSLSLQNKRGQV